MDFASIIIQGHHEPTWLKLYTSPVWMFSGDHPPQEDMTKICMVVYMHMKWTEVVWRHHHCPRICSVVMLHEEIQHIPSHECRKNTVGYHHWTYLVSSMGASSPSSGNPVNSLKTHCTQGKNKYKKVIYVDALQNEGHSGIPRHL